MAASCRPTKKVATSLQPRKQQPSQHGTRFETRTGKAPHARKQIPPIPFGHRDQPPVIDYEHSSQLPIEKWHDQLGEPTVTDSIGVPADLSEKQKRCSTGACPLAFHTPARAQWAERNRTRNDCPLRARGGV